LTRFFDSKNILISLCSRELSEGGAQAMAPIWERGVLPWTTPGEVGIEDELDEPDMSGAPWCSGGGDTDGIGCDAIW
jgi:hypothetical protein